MDNIDRAASTCSAVNERTAKTCGRKGAALVLVNTNGDGRIVCKLHGLIIQRVGLNTGGDKPERPLAVLWW